MRQQVRRPRRGARTTTGSRKPPNIPKNSRFREKFGPRGVVHAWADGHGGQRIEDTGPLTRKRMETIDEEVLAATLDFIERAHEAERPFFLRRRCSPAPARARGANSST
ncbi:hypothetical protein WMF04_01235 [Sorangium sp. So ce260]|uniref:hypothetical protein n=1 Tax=Sorangium sp. So ce260 TaxID=3133291 RepID=UPI003F5E36FF